MELLQIVETTAIEAPQIAVGTAQIRAAILSQSRYIDAANFTRIHPSDLELLFSQYDAAFFAGKVKESLGATPLHFALSKRMTSSGGKTTRSTHRQSGRRHFEISVSTAILFGSFHDVDHRSLTVGGVVCLDRLDALQRVMEHELVHLIEMLLWEESNCSQPRFHSITRRFFGHSENIHRLITPRERAIVKFGIKPGMKVRFRFEGAQRTGIVNRISKRATVLVEDDRGQQYTNGKHYAKFYVPVQSLEAAE